MRRRVFWGSLVICLASLNSLCAVLYAGVEALDSEGGFISLSPLVDCIFWGVPITVFGLIALFTRKSVQGRPLNIPGPLRFPAAYLFSLAGLTAVVFLLGLFRLLYQYSRLHLPLWGYIGLLAALYPAFGCFWGRRWDISLKSGLLWGLLITALLGLMGFSVLLNAHLSESMLPYPEGVPDYEPVVIRESVQTILRHHFPGAALGRINMPACVVMDRYCYAVLELPRELVTMLVCLCPPLLFTAGWLAGTLYHRGKTP